MSGYQGNPLSPYASASPWGAYGSNMLTPWASAWSYPISTAQFQYGQWPQWQPGPWQWPSPQQQWQPQGQGPATGGQGQQMMPNGATGGQQQQPLSLADQAAWLGPAASGWLASQGAPDADVLRAGLNVPGLSDEGRANIYQALQQYGGPPASGYSRPNLGGGGTG